MSVLWSDCLSVFKTSGGGSPSSAGSLQLSSSYAAVSKALHTFRTVSVTYEPQDRGDFRIGLLHSHREGCTRVACIIEVEVRSFREIMRVCWPLNW